MKKGLLRGGELTASWRSSAPQFNLMREIRGAMQDGSCRATNQGSNLRCREMDTRRVRFPVRGNEQFVVCSSLSVQ
jgi:hypothetical protein